MLAIIQCRIFVFQFAVRKYKAQDIQNYNVAFCLYGCKIWSPTVCEKHRLRIFGNRVLRKIFGPRVDVVMGEWGR